MLEAYGSALIEYEGEGVIHLVPEGIIEGRFRCIQLNNSEILIELIDGKPKGRVAIPLQEFYQVKEFEGVLNDNRGLKTGEWVVNTGHKVNHASIAGKADVKLTLILETQLIAVGTNEAKKEPISLIRFALTNFTFDVGAFNGFVIELEVAGVKVRVRHKNEYKELIERMVATKACTVTSFLEIEAGDKLLDELVDIANNLCLLFSFAKGSKISWPYFQLLNEKGEVIFTYHTKTVVFNYALLPIISQDMPEDFFEFIEATYDKFIEVKDKYKLQKIIDVLCQSKSGGLAELAALNVSSAIDVLRATWASDNNRSLIFEETEFSNKIKKPIKEEIGKLLDQLCIDKTKRKEVYEKLGELNRPAFKTVLKEMVTAFDSDMQLSKSSPDKKDEIDEFVSRRDILVHQGRFMSDDDIGELYEVFSVADRLILSILNYKGPRFDYCSDSRIAGKIV